jgi:hypothetical protein
LIHQARNKTSEEYLQIAALYPPERNREAVLTGDYLTGRVSITNPTDEVTFVLILICNASEPREDTKYSSITLMYNNTSQTNIASSMSELHQLVVCPLQTLRMNQEKLF